MKTRCSQVWTSRTVTEDIARISEKIICEVYGKKTADTNVNLEKVLR